MCRPADRREEASPMASVEPRMASGSDASVEPPMGSGSDALADPCGTACLDGAADSYVALDLETTGLSFKKEKIIEIGALKVQGGKVTDRFHSLVDPRRALSQEIVRLTGLTDGQLAGQPGIEAVIGALVDFCEELPLLGHRIQFDYSFLKKAAVDQKIVWERDGIDTLFLCRVFMPKEEKKNLGDACGFFQIETGGSHRALADAEAAHRLYQVLKARYGGAEPGRFTAKKLICKVKREQPATKRQKQRLQELLKCHRIETSVQIDYLTRNEASRLTDVILAQRGRGEEP